MNIPQLLEMDERFYHLLARERIDNYLSETENGELRFLAETCDDLCEHLTSSGEVAYPLWKHVLH